MSDIQPPLAIVIQTEPTIRAVQQKTKLSNGAVLAYLKARKHIPRVRVIDER